MKQQLLTLCILIILAITGCDSIQAPSESQIMEICRLGKDDFEKIEIGKSMTSQDAVMRYGIQGTKIYPLDIKTKNEGTLKAIIFKDLSDKWECTQVY